VYAVDTFKGSIPSEQGGVYDATEQMVKEQGSPLPEFWANVGHWENLRVLIMSSREASRFFRHVDLVFIDGSHDYKSVIDDLETWSPRADKLICGHDYQYESVRRAVRAYFFDSDIEVVKTIWAVKR
jgi:precorrin-6B methylase 2